MEHRQSLIIGDGSAMVHSSLTPTLQPHLPLQHDSRGLNLGAGVVGSRLLHLFPLALIDFEFPSTGNASAINTRISPPPPCIIHTN